VSEELFALKGVQNETEMRAKATKMESKTNQREPKGSPSEAKSPPKRIQRSMFGEGCEKYRFLAVSGLSRWTLLGAIFHKTYILKSMQKSMSKNDGNL